MMTALVRLMSSAITEVVAAVSGYVEAIVKASTHRSLAKETSMEELSVVFSLVALAIIAIKFYLDVIEENSKRKGPDKLEGILQAFRFLGMRLFIVPLIAFAASIPQVFCGITPNAYHATGLVAKRVALMGDNLVTKIGSVYSLHVVREIDGTVAMSGPDSYEGQLVKQAKTNYNQANNNYRVIENEIKELESSKNLHSLDPSVTNKLLWNADKQNKLNSAIAHKAIAKAALDNSSTAFSDTNSAVLTNVKAAKTIAELDAARKLHVAASSTDDSSGSFWSKITQSVGSAVEHTALGATHYLIKSIFSALTNVSYFICHIGFYLCLLPAFIGLIAGAIICLKEALSLLQYGAKLEIIKNLTLGVATIFAPFFMICFLFAKTEQFAWKFLTLMFSMYFGFFALSYACAVLVGPGLSQLGAIMNQLTTISVSQFGESASIELLSSSVAIGLKGLSVGMIAAFLLDIVKSAIAVGHSLIGGNFSVSS